MLLSVLRVPELECAAVGRPLEGMSAGTALMGHKAVSVTVMAGTHKQLAQAEHRPAEKQHMCHKCMHTCYFSICLMQASTDAW